MKILLIGDFSNLHWTLAEGLRILGHDVQVLSTGDVWKNYRRDIDIKFNNKLALLKFLTKFYNSNLVRGFDIVQLIGISFFFTGNKIILNYPLFKELKAKNGRIFLGAFGDDFYYWKACNDNIFKYSSLNSIENIDDAYTQHVKKILSSRSHRIMTEYIAKNVHGIVSGCYEYFKTYENATLSNRHRLIPFPINTNELQYTQNTIDDGFLKILVGIQERRNAWKGTDKILEILRNYQKQNAHRVKLYEVKNMPYNEYIKLLEKSNIIADQLYSYSPAMNALSAMAMGKVVLGGGENEMYEIIGEKQNKPIINITPSMSSYDSVLYTFENQTTLKQLGEKSREFVERHHDYIQIAKKYLEFWTE